MNFLDPIKKIKIVADIINITAQRKIILGVTTEFSENNFPSFLPLIHISKDDELNDIWKKELRLLKLEIFIYLILANINFISNICLIKQGKLQFLEFFQVLQLYIVSNVLNLFHYGETWLQIYFEKNISYHYYLNNIKYAFLAGYIWVPFYGFNGYIIFFTKGKPEGFGLLIITIQIFTSLGLLSLKLILKFK